MAAFDSHHPSRCRRSERVEAGVGLSDSAGCRGFDLDFELWKGQPSHTEKSRSRQIVTEEIRREWSEHGHQFVDVRGVVVDLDDVGGAEPGRLKNSTEILEGLLHLVAHVG